MNTASQKVFRPFSISFLLLLLCRCCFAGSASESSSSGAMTNPTNQLKLLKIIDENNHTVSKTLNSPEAASPALPKFSPDGKLLAILYLGKVEIWDARAWKLLRTLPQERPSDVELVTAMAFSPDSKRIATGGKQKVVKVWDANTGALQQTLNLSQRRYSDINSVTFSPDGELLAITSPDRFVEIWNITSAKLIHSLAGHETSVEEVAFASDGKTLVSGEDGGAIKWWDTSTGQLLRTFEPRAEWLGIIRFSTDAKVLATGRDFGVKLWDSHTGTLLHSIDSKAYKQFYLSPDGTTVITGDGHRNTAMTVQFWDVKSGELKRQGDIRPSAPEMCLDSSPDGKLASGYDTGMVKVWQFDE